MDAPFWKTKTLEQMTPSEWESLCDGCGRCCLHKLRDDVTEVVSFTNVACHLLDLHSCACGDYARRREKVPDCVALTPEALDEIDWLPPSCAYRRLSEGRDMAWWDPLGAGGARPGGQRAAFWAAGASSCRLAWPFAPSAPPPQLTRKLSRLAGCGEDSS